MPRRQVPGAAADKASPSSVSSGATTSSTQLPSHVKKRIPLTSRSSGADHADGSEMTGARDERRPLLDGQTDDNDDGTDGEGWIRRNQWVVLALASGACAAFNGVFAKL